MERPERKFDYRFDSINLTMSGNVTLITSDGAVYESDDLAIPARLASIDAKMDTSSLRMRHAIYKMVFLTNDITQDMKVLCRKKHR